MKYLVAIDSGGTKTDAVLFDETGHILYRDLSSGGNGMDIGKEEAVKRILGVLDRISTHAPEKIHSIYGGIAGVMPLGDFFSPYVAPRNYAEIIRFEDDGLSPISATLGRQDGCCMVCGTGSSLFIRVEGQPLRKIGGKGYLIDTGGSGYELGREAIAMAFRATEGRCRHTVLVELVEKAMGKPVQDSMPDIYNEKTGGRAFIASFAHTVFQGRRMGDWACQEIFDKGVHLLADLTHAAEKFFPGDFSVVMNGGLVTAFPEYTQAITEKASKHAKMVLAANTPVFGAAVEAMWDAQVPITAEFKERFLADFALYNQK